MTRPCPRALLGALAALACAAVVPATAPAKPLTKATWLKSTRITEYFPVPEKWFVGRRVTAAGLPGRHRIDWLYGAGGLSMEGDGFGLDGQRYHIGSTGNAGWINARGHRTVPGAHGWSRGAPFWRAGGYWTNAGGRPTFPLDGGGWFMGAGQSYKDIPGVTFGTGPSLPLVYYASLAVDPSLIPIGSRVYLPPYRHRTPSHGWFVAQDTGGAIRKRHVDVYRPAPASSSDTGNSYSNMRIRVLPPGVDPGDGPVPPARIVGYADPPPPHAGQTRSTPAAATRG